MRTLIVIAALLSIGCGPCVERRWVYHRAETFYIKSGNVLIPITDDARYSCDCVTRARRDEPVADIQTCSTPKPLLPEERPQGRLNGAEGHAVTPSASEAQK